jgi:penicillin-binding protein 1A
MSPFRPSTVTRAERISFALRLLRTPAQNRRAARIWGGIGGVGVVAYYGAQHAERHHLDHPGPLAQHQDRLRDGALIANRGMTGGEASACTRCRPIFPQAVIAIEDRRFYSHFGIDPLGLARAMVTNVTTGRWSRAARR